MKVSKWAVDFIKDFEELELVAYKPTKDDVWTIGYGHTKGVKQGDTITEAEADAFLREDIQVVEEAIARNVKVKLNQNQYDALVSFVFNIGEPQFKKSTMLRKINANDFSGASAEFPRWNKQKRRVLAGLTRRRKGERERFDTPVRTNVAQSTTVQASAAQLMTGAVTGVGAVSALSGTAQIVALCIAGVVVLTAAWIMRERIKKWSKGIK